jgi:hypothetical protein
MGDPAADHASVERAPLTRHRRNQDAAVRAGDHLMNAAGARPAADASTESGATSRQFTLLPESLRRA